MSIVDGIARLLAARGCGAYSPDAKLPAGQTPIAILGYPSGNGPAIVLSTYDGLEPDSRNRWEYPRLQVKVRDTNSLQALALERTTYDVLQGLGGVMLPHAGTDPVWFLQDCYAQQSEAAPLGRDDNNRWEFARNYQLTCWLA